MNKSPRKDKSNVIGIKNIGQGAVDTETIFHYVTNLDCVVGDILRYKTFKGWKKFRNNKNLEVEIVEIRDLKETDSLSTGDFAEIVNIGRTGRKIKPKGKGRTKIKDETKVKKGKERKEKGAISLVTKEAIKDIALTRKQEELREIFMKGVEALCKPYQDEINELQLEIQKHDIKQSELLHDLETVKISASDGCKFATALQETRQLRRLLKDQVNDCETMINTIKKSATHGLQKSETQFKKSLVIRNEWQENFKIKSLEKAN